MHAEMSRGSRFIECFPRGSWVTIEAGSVDPHGVPKAWMVVESSPVSISASRRTHDGGVSVVGTEYSPTPHSQRILPTG
jgi:hypothetical protein